jgi:hypothetical protein
VINVIFLTRIFEDATLGKSPGGSFTIQLLILLTSVIILVYKALHLKDFPAWWREQKLLLIEGRQLAERLRVLHASAEPTSGLRADEDTASESGADNGKPVVGAVVESVSGSDRQQSAGLSLLYD